jgi:hypothetical protein
VFIDRHPAAQSPHLPQHEPIPVNGHTSRQVYCLDLSPLFATLTKIAGVWGHSSHFGTNHDRAGTPENYKQFVIPGARGKGGKNYTCSYSRDANIE